MTEIARDVLIIGADAAGLTAANALRMSGLSVVVLDENDRIRDDSDELPHLLAERLGEDVLLSYPVRSVRWAPTPSVTAICDHGAVRARFAVVSPRAADAIAFEPVLASPEQDSPIHFATSDDTAMRAATAIVETVRS